MTDECPTPWKLSHPSRQEAKAYVKRGTFTASPKGQQRPYRCVCGKWHTTSMGRNALRLARKGRKAA